EHGEHPVRAAEHLPTMRVEARVSGDGFRDGGGGPRFGSHRFVSARGDAGVQFEARARPRSGRRAARTRRLVALDLHVAEADGRGLRVERDEASHAAFGAYVLADLLAIDE